MVFLFVCLFLVIDTFFIFINNFINLDILSISGLSHYWLLEARGVAKHLPMHERVP